jgi:hypothetical protein
MRIEGRLYMFGCPLGGDLRGQMCCDPYYCGEQASGTSNESGGAHDDLTFGISNNCYASRASLSEGYVRSKAHKNKNWLANCLQVVDLAHKSYLKAQSS